MPKQVAEEACRNGCWQKFDGSSVEARLADVETRPDLLSGLKMGGWGLGGRYLLGLLGNFRKESV